MTLDPDSSADDELDLAGVEVDRDVVAVQRVRARAFGKLFGEELPPPRIGRFEVLREVGHGGMGVVYAAFDPQLERNVALKVLRRRGHGHDDRGQARLLREARAAARLSHPNVVTVYEVGEDAGAIHIAMELLDAVTLRGAVARMGDDWRAIVTAYLAAGRGLLAAHEAGIVHRDFKPDNVLVADSRVCVTDFGLALAEVGPSDDDAASTEVTQGAVGTVPYMAPEQLRGEPATVLADQFGYCVSLWEALYGRRPFVGATAAELVAAIERGAIDSTASANARAVPAALRELCRRGLAADPRQRYPSLAPLLAGLERIVAPTRRTWWIPIAVAGAALGLGALALRDDAEVCTGAAAQLAPVWSPARRDALRRAVEATALPYAIDVARELDAQLERYAQTWSAAHREACLATRVRAEASEQALDRTMACLGDRIARFDATLGVLERVDAAVVESALAVSAALPSISSCTAADARAARITLPEDAEARAEVQRQLAALEAGTALRRAGRPHDSASALAAVALAAETLGHPPLGAVVRVEQAETALALADSAGAARGLDEALELAGSAHELDVVAHAAVAQAAAVVQQGDAAAVRGVIRAARIAVATAGDPPRQRARLLQIDSRAAYTRGEFDLALDSGLASLALVTAEQGERSLDLAEALHVVAAAHHGRGDYRAAAEQNGRARAIREALLGARHPLVADSWANLGGTHLAMGELDAATASFDHALEIRRAVFGDEHPSIADLLLNQGGIAAQRGDLDRALADFSRALAILEGRLGRDHPRTIPALLNLAGLALQRGDLESARAMAERGMTRVVELHGESHPSVAVALGHLAEVAVRTGDPERAVGLLRRALTIREAALGPSHPQLARTLQALAEAELALGEVGPARAHAERAVGLIPTGEGKSALQGWIARLPAAP